MIRPLTPTTEELNALDAEVEEKQKKNVLVAQDFSVPDAYKGMGKKEKFVRKYLIPPGQENDSYRIKTRLFILRHPQCFTPRAAT